MRSTFRDEGKLRWFFAGGIYIEAAPPSSYEVMIAAINRGTAEPLSAPGGNVSLQLLGRATEHRELQRRLETLRGNDSLSYQVLCAACSVPAPHADHPLRPWGYYAAVLFVMKLAVDLHRASHTWLALGEWLERLLKHEDEETIRIRDTLAHESEVLVQRAIAAWESV